MTFSSIRKSWYSRLINFCLMVTFVTTMVITPRASYAVGVMGLPQPGTMVDLSPAYVPLMITGLTVHPENPLLMDFIVSTGNSGLNAIQVKKESGRLIKYFLACLTIPENDQWVNLSPYEKQRIVPEDLGQTVLGQDMLAQDYLLKQLTASLIYPEKNLGKNFWDKVYAKASEMYGTTQIPVNTFNKVWILPDTVKVYEHKNTVFVVKSHLKVMLDEDYLALSKHTPSPVIPAKAGIFNNNNINNLGSQIVRQIILPAIEQEVNTGKNFAQLRQIYNSMILAVWFKKNLKEALLNQVYSDKSKVNGVNADDPAIKDKIYQQYLQAYKKGVFNYIKEEPADVSLRGAEGDVAISNETMIPRKYFSGGITAPNPAIFSTATGEERRTFWQAPGQRQNFILRGEARQVPSTTSAAMLSYDERAKFILNNTYPQIQEKLKDYEWYLLSSRQTLDKILEALVLLRSKKQGNELDRFLDQTKDLESTLIELRRERDEERISSQINEINNSNGQYQAKVINQEGHKLVEFTDQREKGTSFTIMVDKGFRVISWVVAGKEVFRVPENLNDSGSGIFSMFPWVNRLKDGKIVRNGRTIYITSKPGHNMEKIEGEGQEPYYLQTVPGLTLIDGNPIHGVALVSETWKDWNVGMDDQGAYIQASFETTDYPGLSEVFGHSKLTKKFYLNGHTLTTDVEVENLMTESEAARDGGYEAIADVGEHGFQLFTPGKTELQIEGVEGVFLLDKKIPIGEPVAVPEEQDFRTPKTIKGGELDDTFTVRANAEGIITARMMDKHRTTTMTLGGIFSAPPGQLAVLHAWDGGSDKKSFYGAIEPVPVTANGPNRQGKIGGTRPFPKYGEKRTGRVTMTIKDAAMTTPVPVFDLNKPNGHYGYWLQQPVSVDNLVDDMFRDYDYRFERKGQDLNPAIVFQIGLVWAKMALEKAKKAGITKRTVLIARDARKANPQIMDALVAAMRYSGLDVIYIAESNPNAVTSYSWAVQQFKPLMSIFHTASHVSRPNDVYVRGFKVAMMDEIDGGIKSLTTQEIKQNSFSELKELLQSPDKVSSLRSPNPGHFRSENVVENVIRFNTLVGDIAASKGSLYRFGEDIKKSDNPLVVLKNYEQRYGQDKPLQGIKVVVDGSHTPSGELAVRTFRNLGADVTSINTDIQEIWGEHKADPSAKENLVELESKIKETGAHFGLAFDLDGDRGAILVPESTGEVAYKEFHSLAPDNLLGALLPTLINQWGYKQSGKQLAIIRDVLGTHAVNDKGKELGIPVYQTDAGYVFLKAKKQVLEKEGIVVPMYGERSGHTWLHVSGEIENPLAVAVLFAVLAKRKMDTNALNPVYDVYQSLSIPYSQSPRFQPLFHPDFLRKLGESRENTSDWRYDPKISTPQKIIGLGRDRAIKLLQGKFAAGNSFETSAGNLTVKEFNSYADPQDEGGLYRYADIVFEQDGKFAGRFIFRASSNDPSFVNSYEAPQWENEDIQKTRERKAAIAKLVLNFLRNKKIALITKDEISENMPHLSNVQVEGIYKKYNLNIVEADLNDRAMLLPNQDETISEDEEGQEGYLTNDAAMTVISPKNSHPFNALKKMEVGGVIRDKAALAKSPEIRGGIDLNSRNLKMESSGQKVNVTFDPVMIAQFKRGDFSGVKIQILDVVPVNLMPLLGLKEDAAPRPS